MTWQLILSAARGSGTGQQFKLRASKPTPCCRTASAPGWRVGRAIKVNRTYDRPKPLSVPTTAWLLAAPIDFDLRAAHNADLETDSDENDSAT